MFVAFVAIAGTPAAAQPTHPIYVQYDGFIRNADDSLTLSFGYHNLNRVEVTIDRGDQNRFLSGGLDRAQPTMFRAGRHRFACVMMVRPGARIDVRWQVQFAGHTSTTTERILDPRYALEAASARRVVEGLDPGTATEGVCVTERLAPDR